ncbi:restriction endonuclease subunit S [Imhoffiella purpurea]|uniref:Type I restriction-modification system, specificity subunit S n=1 Tax=Imhoffiella purpurea TaxID=1249627 RepID=W9V362_9GAMM|nr:restriction endonuclease subunit S [Imhoffiella purpurea]EXJ13933.1 Type I restriction-modification system, specificity subunit S [Imhoffiella purpurea]
MGEWRQLTLDQAGISLIDCVHKTPAAVEAGMPYVAIPEMRGGEIDLSGARKISKDDFVEWTRKANPEPYDVVLSRRCNPGETAFVRPGMTFALGQNLVLLRADGTCIHRPFLRWLVRTPEWWNEIERYRNVGAVFDSLRCADVPNFRLSIPPLEEQRYISSLLGALDDKIELNRQTNATLEAMARALFKDWFVDFGPTRAKAEGRAPYLAPHLWDLFPDALDALDDEDKPVGWTTEPLLDHARLISGGTPKTDITAYWNGSIAWASAKDVSQCSDAFLIETERSITPRGLEESSTRLIPKGATVVVARGATTGRYCLFGAEMAMNQTCYALTSLKQRPFWLNCAFGFLVQELVHSAHGSVFDTITTKTVQQAWVTISKQELIFSFEETVTPLFTRIHSNLEESRTLAQTRDLLLPKLMSGEIRLREAEQIAEAVL